MTSHDRARHKTAVFWIALAIICSAGIAVLGHAAAKRTDWRWVLLLRGVGGVILAWILVRGSGATLGQGGRTPLFILCASAGLSIVLYFYALAGIPSADALVLRGTAPLWIALGAWAVLRQPIGVGLWLGLACGFLGMVLIQQPHVEVGNMAAVAGAASGALLAVAQHALRRLRHVPARLIVLFYSLVILAVSVVVILLAKDTLTARGLKDPWVITMALGTAVLGTVGTIAVTRAVAVSTVQTVGASGYAGIGLAAAADLLWFGLTPTAIGVAGLVLTVVPTLIIMFQRPKRRRIFRARLAHSPEISDVDTEQIEQAIVAAENVTSCEVRVHIDKAETPMSRSRLEGLFASLGMTNTKLRNGMLVAVSNANEVCVLADAGILEVSSTQVLENITTTIGKGVEQSGVEAGISEGLALASAHLKHWFPVQSDDIDELPNEVSIG